MGSCAYGKQSSCEVMGIGSIEIHIFDGIVRTLFNIKHACFRYEEKFDVLGYF